MQWNKIYVTSGNFLFYPLIFLKFYNVYVKFYSKIFYITYQQLHVHLLKIEALILTKLYHLNKVIILFCVDDLYLPTALFKID